MKILVIRFSSIGDIVLTSPVVRCLKKQLGAEVHYLTKKNFASIVSNNPYIDKVVVMEDSLWQTVLALREENYDYIIDLHHNLRSLIVKTFLMKQSQSFQKLNIEKWLLVNFKINRLPKVHIVDRYLQTCARLGVKNDGAGLDYFVKPEDEVDVRTLPTAFQNGYVAWVIGAKQKTKQFPAEKVIATLSLPHFPSNSVLLLGGEEDAVTAQKICDTLSGNAVHVFNACGKFSLNNSASLLKQATAVITNDTGLMHMAAAFQKPIVSIWGNTVPELGMTPCFGNVTVASHTLQITERLGCRPCSKLGYEACPQGHFDCMKKIKEEALVKELERIITTAHHTLRPMI